jgi:hypothetical protein
MPSGVLILLHSCLKDNKSFRKLIHHFSKSKIRNIANFTSLGGHV